MKNARTRPGASSSAAAPSPSAAFAALVCTYSPYQFIVHRSHATWKTMGRAHLLDRGRALTALTTVCIRRPLLRPRRRRLFDSLFHSLDGLRWLSRYSRRPASRLSGLCGCLRAGCHDGCGSGLRRRCLGTRPRACPTGRLITYRPWLACFARFFLGPRAGHVLTQSSHVYRCEHSNIRTRIRRVRARGSSDFGRRRSPGERTCMAEPPALSKGSRHIITAVRGVRRER